MEIIFLIDMEESIPMGVYIIIIIHGEEVMVDMEVMEEWDILVKMVIVFWKRANNFLEILIL